MSVHELAAVEPQPIELPEDTLKPIPRKKSVLAQVAAQLVKIQKFSAYGFLGFVGLHATTVVVLPGLGIGLQRNQEVFEMTRNIYLSPLFEWPFVVGTVLVHVTSGVCLRFITPYIRRTVRPRKENEIIIKDGRRDDIGLGGVGTILGLGFKKSWISSTFPSLTPLSFSGYIMAVSLGFHYYFMRYLPATVDGDLLLITLKYVTHYLRQSSLGRPGTLLNTMMLLTLLYASFYHMVTGMFKYRRQFSMRAKKIAYSVIGSLSLLSAVSIFRFRVGTLDTGFMGRQFAKYIYA